MKKTINGVNYVTSIVNTGSCEGCQFFDKPECTEVGEDCRYDEIWVINNPNAITELVSKYGKLSESIIDDVNTLLRTMSIEEAKTKIKNEINGIKELVSEKQ